MKISRTQSLLLLLSTLVTLGVLAAWVARSIAVYDDCLDRIDYDKARWHLCD